MIEDDLCAGSEFGKHWYRFCGPGGTLANCERPRRLACFYCDDVITTRCSASSRAKCGPCSETYRRRVGRIFASGRSDLVTERMFFLTVTAPSDRGRHRIGNGGPWCPCTPEGGVNIAEWNSCAGLGWSHFVEDLRREFGRDLEFCKAAEAQERGAMHFHALVRVRADLERSLPRVRALAIKNGFGHEVDLRTAREGDEWYCAKYASKSAADRADVPWLDRRTGELLIGNPRMRVWTSSRNWGLTMLALRRLQAAWFRGGGGRTGDEAGAGLAPPGLALADQHRDWERLLGLFAGESSRFVL